MSKSLDSRELAKHRAVIAVELEVLAKKFDRFGWERDRNSPAHDRLIIDWMDALADYPLAEVRAACRAAVIESPNKMPNEGHILAEIMKARREYLLSRPPLPHPEPAREPVSQQRREAVLAEMARRFPSLVKIARGKA